MSPIHFTLDGRVLPATRFGYTAFTPEELQRAVAQIGHVARSPVRMVWPAVLRDHLFAEELHEVDGALLVDLHALIRLIVDHDVSAAEHLEVKAALLRMELPRHVAQAAEAVGPIEHFPLAAHVDLANPRYRCFGEPGNFRGTASLAIHHFEEDLQRSEWCCQTVQRPTCIDCDQVLVGDHLNA